MKSVLAFFAMLILVSVTQAQQPPLQAGDAPRAANIRIETLSDLRVQVIGDAGAVFASAQVALRNPYTLETVTTTARADGSFRAEISGVAAMPLQVYAARSFPQAEIAAGGQLSGAGTWIVPAMNRQSPQFGLGGRLSYGAGNWLASGRLDRLQANPGERLSAVLDVMLQFPDADSGLPYLFGGELVLRQIYDEQGRQISNAQSKNWSSFLTPEGLPILGAGLPDIRFAQAATNRFTLAEDGSHLRIRLPFSADLPAELAAGWYELIFTGSASIADSDSFDWYANRVFGTTGTGTGQSSMVALPLLLQVGDPVQPRPIISLFDTLGQQDAGQAAYANLVYHSPAITIRAPQQSSLTMHFSQAGRAPSGTIFRAADLRLIYRYPDSSGECVLTMDQIAIEGDQLRIRVPRDCPQPASYGDYQVQLTGIAYDAAGRELRIDSTFAFIVAEPLMIHPAALSGTIFAPDDPIADFVQLSPAFPARWRVTTMRSQQSVSGVASAAGIFFAGIPLLSDQSGAAIVDYSARYADSDGRLWVGALRALYLRADHATASGIGGLADYTREQQAWFDTRVYPPDAPNIAPVVNFPLFSSDLALIPDIVSAGIRPALMDGDFQYLSMVRPGLSLRQFVRAGDFVDGRLLADDLLLGQVGAGSAGLRPGDVLLLSGATAGDELAGYAATGSVTSGNAARVVPAFSAPVIANNAETLSLALLPTAALAGQVLQTGDSLTVAGYVLPAVPAPMALTVSAPDQSVQVRNFRAGQYGYFANPEPVQLNQSGVYWLTLDAAYSGITSTGTLARAVSGTVPGAARYPLFVLEQGEPALETTRASQSTVTVGQSFTINVRLPADWTDVRAYAVARTAQQTLEISTLNTFSNQTNYTFDWARAARLYPNLETRGSGAADVDEITFILAMTGTDPQGVARIRARVFTLRAGQLITLSGGE